MTKEQKIKLVICRLFYNNVTVVRQIKDSKLPLKKKNEVLGKLYDILNSDEKYKSKLTKNTYNLYKGILEFAFLWEQTKEGFNYWASVSALLSKEKKQKEELQ